MELAELQKLLPTYAELKEKIIESKGVRIQYPWRDQWDPNKHAIHDTAKRPDKSIVTDQGAKNVPVARLSVPLQQRIVKFAATFLCANPIRLSATPTPGVQTDLLTMIQRTWDDNKLDYETKELVKMMLSETECAEIWYIETTKPDYWDGTPNQGLDLRLRVKQVAPSLGDQLYPVFNSKGDMIAFGRHYHLKDGTTIEEHFDIYTADATFLALNGGGATATTGWTVKTEPNTIGKIPVIYFHQPTPEWFTVQEMIDRIEKLMSNHADSNDYFGSPIITVAGKINGFSAKGEQGKVLELDNGATAEYLTWDQAPASVALEYNNLLSQIYNNTDTPNISFETMKGLGALSGIAIKLLFMGAHMKAADKEAIFGRGIQRRINFIKATMTLINLKLKAGQALTIKPKFEYYLPKNDQEIIANLSTATGGNPSMSQRTAVANNPYVQDPAAELQLIKTEGLDQEMNNPPGVSPVPGSPAA